MRISGLIIVPAICGSLVASAQDVREAYNLSNFATQGSARSIGFGNALGSVGGDFGSLSVNPAGLGVYRSSELSITPSLKVNGTMSDYAGSGTSDNNTRFGISQFAMVFTNAPKGKRYDRRAWKSVSFAFGMNRLNDFNVNSTYSGKNTTSSGSQVFESDANHYPTDATTSDVNNAPGNIGWWSHLLNQDSHNNFYTVVPFTGGVLQTKSVEERGSLNEYCISLGGNYKEKLMLGATVGVPSFHFTRTSSYSETLAPGNTASNPENFSMFSYGQTLDISGTGINLKLGAIYKFSKYFRAGIALHTPSYYWIHDEYDPSMRSLIGGTQYYLNTSFDGGLAHNTFDYSLSTPWKAVLSATGIINDRGFITADYEYVDYSSARYHYGDNYDPTSGINYFDAENAINQQIKKTYKGVSNFRLGGELRVARELMVRAGFGYYGDPYTTSGKEDMPVSYTTQRIDISVGVGFHSKQFFTDVGFLHSMYSGYDQPYVVDYSANRVISGTAAVVPTAKIDYSLNNIAWTVGVKF
jgi:long-subunit fatty acid transport protein